MNEFPIAVAVFAVWCAVMWALVQAIDHAVTLFQAQ